MTATDQKLLSFIVPIWEGSKSHLKPLLRSLDAQVGIDFSQIEIILSSGNQETFDMDFSDYPNIKDSIKFYGRVCDKKGPGQSRQVGLDNAVGHFIGFADHDDVLYSITSFAEVLEELLKAEQENIPFDSMVFRYYDVYGSNLYKQDASERKIIPFCVWCQYFKRSSLMEKNISFNMDITSFEDVYFIYRCIYSGFQWIYRENIAYAHIDDPTSTGHVYDHSSVALRDSYTWTSDLLDRFPEINLYQKEELIAAYVNTFYASFTAMPRKIPKEDVHFHSQNLTKFLQKYCPNFKEELKDGHFQMLYPEVRTWEGWK